MKILVVGGGPAGLYFARLLRRSRPEFLVRVVEQNAPDATFGFGVGLGGKARDRLRAMDPEVHDRISARMVFTNRQNIHLNGTDIPLEYAQTGGAIARLDLLRILRAACAEVGVELVTDRRIETAADLDGYDLVVGADGANSIVRRLHADTFGTSVYNLTNHFAWYGVARAMKPSALVFRETDRGRFVGHYYAYTDAMSTFVAECDGETWRRSGMAGMDDRERRALMEEVFAPELEGSPLVENRSIWRNFPVVTNARWHGERVVLIGDSLLTAHFSIGSGTRLAMDDAAALYEAVVDARDVPGALARFEERRRPVRERFREAAERSFTWYEHLARVMRSEPVDFVYDFLTRTGRIDEARLAEYAPAFHRLWRAHTERRAAAVA